MASALARARLTLAAVSLQYLAGCGVLSSLSFECGPQTPCPDGQRCRSGACIPAALADAAAADVSIDAASSDDRGGEADGGVQDGASGAGPSWWNEAYAFRAHLELTAQASDIPAGYPLRFDLDHGQLVQAGKSRSDGDDLRLVYWDGAANHELARALADGHRWAMPSTRLFFHAQAPIASAQTDASYWVYYGNTDARAAEARGVVRARYFYKEQLQRVQYDGVGQHTVSSLDFSPTAPEQRWLVALSWRQQHTDASDDENWLGVARIVVNGVPRTGCDQIGGRLHGGAWKTFSTFFIVQGVSTPQSVVLEFSADDGDGDPDALDKVRLLALLLPGEAQQDVALAEALAPTFEDSDGAKLQLSVTPPQVEDYVWMAFGLHHEGPGRARSLLTARDPSGMIRQQSSETFIDHEAYVPLLHIERLALDRSPQVFHIFHEPSNSAQYGPGSDLQGLIQVAFRAELFDRVAHVERIERSQTTATSYVPLLSLSTDSTAVPHDTIYFAVVGADVNGEDFVSHRVSTQFRLDSTVLATDQLELKRDIYPSQATVFAAETGLGGRELSAHQMTADPARPGHAENGHLLALRLKEAASELGPEQERP